MAQVSGKLQFIPITYGWVKNSKNEGMSHAVIKLNEPIKNRKQKMSHTRRASQGKFHNFK